MFNIDEYKSSREEEYGGSSTSSEGPAVREGEYHSELADRLKGAHNENIVRYNSIFVEGSLLVFVERYYGMGSIQDQLDRGTDKTIELKFASRCTLGLLKALNYLHTNGMVHGGIETSKILIDPNSTYGVLLADHQLYDVYNEVTNNVIEGSSLEKRA